MQINMQLLHPNDPSLTTCWSSSLHAKRVQNFLLPLMERGTASFFQNIKTDMYALFVDDIVLPISVNESEYDNAYVCSPYGQYIRFAKEQIGSLSFPLLEPV